MLLMYVNHYMLPILDFFTIYFCHGSEKWEKLAMLYTTNMVICILK